MTATIGIDLASQPKNTALCAIEWEPLPRVVALGRGVIDPGGKVLDDNVLIAAFSGDLGGHSPVPPAKVAIDAPFGWPTAFVDALRRQDGWPVKLGGDRRPLERRATDRWVYDQTEKLPLSVSTDRIAYPAMRLAGILAEYTARGGLVDRSGQTGLLCEAYPDPAIRRLGLWPGPPTRPRESYKGRAACELRRAIMNGLRALAPWLIIGDEHVEACIQEDDSLDALVCALVARASAIQQVERVPPEDQRAASREGWIHLPVHGCLAQLRG